MAISVVVAVGSVADPLVEAIAARIPDVVVGAGDDPSSMMGPLITPEHRDRVQAYVEQATGEGATVVVDGSGTLRGTGFFVGCSLLDDVKPGMRVYDDEIFGPVLSVVRVPTLDDALALVNDNPYGNGTALFTRDGGAARRFEREVHVGMVGDQRPDPGTRGVTLVRRVEGFHLRGFVHLRARRGPVLHSAKGRDVSMARPRSGRCGAALPNEPLNRARPGAGDRAVTRDPWSQVAEPPPLDPGAGVL